MADRREPGEESGRSLQPGDAAMRHGGAAADAGAAELLALPQSFENNMLVQIEERCRATRHFLQRLSLAGDAQLRKDSVRSEKIGDLHHVPMQPPADR